ncbi:MAG: hypothetical protein J2P45_09860 [Candidatus Dormibacteraeota bacterium]|nr:hypothetical protein [Candidatus Dormibacteraeota bacterium]
MTGGLYSGEEARLVASSQLDVETPATGQRSVERLLTGLEALTAQQMELVAGAWRQLPRQRREAAWAAIRRFWRRGAGDDSLDHAFRARGAASELARLAGIHDWAFPAAALDAALAVSVADKLSERHYRPLVQPMALALPWILDGPSHRGGVKAT